MVGLWVTVKGPLKIQSHVTDQATKKLRGLSIPDHHPEMKKVKVNQIARKVCLTRNEMKRARPKVAIVIVPPLVRLEMKMTEIIHFQDLPLDQYHQLCPFLEMTRNRH